MFRLYAIAVLLLSPLQAQEPPDPPATQRPVRPDVKEDDPGRPVLKRGGPATKREQVAPPASTSTNSPASTNPVVVTRPAATTSIKPQPGEIVVNEDGTTDHARSAPPRRAGSDELIERAREAAYDFSAGLPNFLCDQLTVRYRSDTLKPNWRYKDRVEVELVFVNQKEDYRNIRINGKVAKKGGPEDTGTWSSGEFGTTLMDIFASNTDAKFRLRGPSQAAGLAAIVYDYSVLQPNSHWEIRFNGSVKPAYRGAVWIDPKTARVLRVEMNTRQLPSTYEVDTVESIVDYGWVTLSGQKFLLPVKSQNLACFRGTFQCTKNEIEFRNYRKFQVESQIMQVESGLVLPDEEESKKTTPPSIKPEATPPPKKKQ